VRALAAARGGRTPAIALTAYGSAADRATALAAGFNAHLPKPVSPDALLAAVASVIPSVLQRSR
jgi:CheY-like chemotaxis protein